jgi:hypothetical protein
LRKSRKKSKHGRSSLPRGLCLKNVRRKNEGRTRHSWRHSLAGRPHHILCPHRRYAFSPKKRNRSRNILKGRLAMGAHSYDRNGSANAIREIPAMYILILDKSSDEHVLQSLAGQHFESGITTTEAAVNMNWMTENGLGNRQCSFI